MVNPQETAATALKCRRCGGPATVGEGPWEGTQCLKCSSISGLDIPATQERRAPVPAEIATGPAWQMIAPVSADRELWLHQAEALGALNRGENVVVATATASGKSLVFQAWTLHGIKASPETTTLVFYPTKALANDQERRWLEACELVGLPRETVGKINGDVGVNRRDPIISRARVVIMTPDVCHAWMTRRADRQSVREFLAKLRNIIIDEAHVYEDVFGSNAAYLFRRLAIAAVNAGIPTLLSSWPPLPPSSAPRNTCGSSPGRNSRWWTRAGTGPRGIPGGCCICPCRSDVGAPRSSSPRWCPPSSRRTPKPR